MGIHVRIQYRNKIADDAVAAQDRLQLSVNIDRRLRILPGSGRWPARRLLARERVLERGVAPAAQPANRPDRQIGEIRVPAERLARVDIG